MAIRFAYSGMTESVQVLAKLLTGLIFLLLLHKLWIRIGLFPPSSPVPFVAQHLGYIAVLSFCATLCWFHYALLTDDAQWEDGRLLGFIMLGVTVLLTYLQFFA
ncbi:MAG: hypothetical protein JWM46_715 [Candidatus Kaiserbacteria bacterium]|nr:hypothetical protein [Candidatus Kaiserbacteria bacterium]